MIVKNVETFLLVSLIQTNSELKKIMLEKEAFKTK